MASIRDTATTRFFDSSTGTSPSGITSVIGSRVDSYDMGDRVVDVNMSSFMRQCDIEFISTGLSPNTQVYAFFDDEDVNEFCYQLPGGNMGSGLTSDAGGNLRGIFRIPEGRFFVGKKAFKLTGSQTNSTDPDMILTSAMGYFFAGGLDITKQNTTLNVLTPTMTFEEAAVKPAGPIPLAGVAQVPPPMDGICWNGSAVAADGTCAPLPPPVNITPTCGGYNTWSDYLISSIGFDPGHGVFSPDPNFNIRFAACQQSCGWAGALASMSCITTCMGGIIPPPPCDGSSAGDPVAQSFKLPADRFLSGIDIFFKTVDTKSSDIWVQIRTMENGYPTNTPLSEKRFAAASIPFSEDASLPLHVEFDFPVFVKGGEEYCFVVGGWSPNTRIWVAKLGEESVNMPGVFVETQPSLGSSFRSQNGTTWNAEQYEDIKYDLYVAKFKSPNNTMQLAFKQKNQRELLKNNPFEASTTSKLIRVYHTSHGMHAGDKFSINMLEGDTYRIHLTSGNIVIGHTIRTLNGSCIVDYVLSLGNNDYDIRVKELSGDLTPETGQTIPFICDGFNVVPRDLDLDKLMGIPQSDTFIRGCSGVISVGPLKQINNVEIKNLIGEHTVYQAESIDTYSFEVNNLAFPRESGVFGGSGIFVTANTQYNVFNMAANYKLYGCDEQWHYTGTRHNQYSGRVDNGIFSAFDYVKDEPKLFEPLTDNFLPHPHKIASDINAKANNLDNSIDIRATLQAPSEWISPMLNLESFTLVNVANRVELIDETMFNAEPNGLGRYSPETKSFDGSEVYKYVTKSVFLKNPAIDLKIAVDVFKDITADFDIYYKTVSPYQESTIDEIDWINIPIKTKVDSINEDDRIEYELLLSDVFGVDWTNEPFIGFKVKIVGKASNSSKPPTFKSLRIVAVL